MYAISHIVNAKNHRIQKYYDDENCASTRYRSLLKNSILGLSFSRTYLYNHLETCYVLKIHYKNYVAIPGFNKNDKDHRNIKMLILCPTTYLIL